MCHKCGKSALKGPIITCDFCPLSWHLDCMDPPMTAPLPPNKRWICPAHAEPLLVSFYVTFLPLSLLAIFNRVFISIFISFISSIG
jgi:hypothetical protein